MAELATFQSSDGVMHGVAWCDVLMLFATGECTPTNQRDTDPWLLTLTQRFPEGIAIVPVVEVGTPIPSTEAREQIIVMYNRHADALRAVALAMEGEGFRAAAVRASFAGVNILQRRPYPTSVFSGLQAALAWAVGKLPPEPGRGTLAEAWTDISRARAKIFGR